MQFILAILFYRAIHFSRFSNIFLCNFHLGKISFFPCLKSIEAGDAPVVGLAVPLCAVSLTRTVKEV